MRTPGQALIWELWRISRWDLIFRAVGGSVLWVTIFCFLETGRDGLEPIAGFALLTLAGTSVFSATWMQTFENRRTGFCFPLGYSRPISTRVLVAAPMAYIACTSVLSFWIPAALLRFLFGIPFPLLPTAALIVAVSACFVSAAWSSASFAARMVNLVAVGAVLGGLILWWNWQHGIGTTPLFFTKNWPTIFAFSLMHYLVLLMVFVCAVVVTTFAVDRQRHGERFQIKAVSRAICELTDRLPRRTRPFTTPVRAQFWLEMRRSGVSVLLIGVCAAILAFLYISYVDLNSEPLRGKAAVMWLILLAVCPFVYQILGAEWLLGLKRRQGAVWLSTFDATQAMGNDGLIAVKLAVLAISVLVSWLVMVFAAATQTAICGRFGDLVRVSETIAPLVANVSAPWWAAVVIIALALCASSSAMLIAIGLWLPRHPKALGGAAFVVLSHVCLAVWDSRHGGVLVPLWTAYGWFLSAGLVVVCFIALRKSLKWGCLGKRFLAIALCLWAVLVSATVTLYLKVVPVTVTVPLSALVLGLGMMTMPLTAAAIAPLALASHRHR